jgi:uncharacterized protein YqhQ
MSLVSSRLLSAIYLSNIPRFIYKLNVYMSFIHYILFFFNIRKVSRYQRGNQGVIRRYQRGNQGVIRRYQRGNQGVIRRYQRGNQKIPKG